MTEDKLTTWDAAKYLDTREALEEYLIAAFEDGDPRLIAAAIVDVVRAVGMRDFSRIEASDKK